MRWRSRSTRPSNGKCCKTTAAGPTPLPAAARSSGGWPVTTPHDDTPTAVTRAPPLTKGPTHPLRCSKPLNHKSRVHYMGSRPDIADGLDLYWVVTDGDDNLIGFSCVESAACVRGLDPDPEILDVGVGTDPCLVGQGSGRAFGKAVHDHLGRRYPGGPLRAVIQSWNMRSRRFAATLVLRCW